MAKSRRTCYFTDQKDLWSPRPMRFWASNKKNKVMCHRIERAWERELILWEMKQLE